MANLVWPHLLPVALRLRVAQAVLQLGEPFVSYQIDPAASDVQAQFDKLVDSQLGASRGEFRNADDVKRQGPAIDFYFKRVADQLAELAESKSKESPMAGGLFDAIVRSCQSSLCRECAGSKPCEWTLLSGIADVKQLETGLCLQIFREIFEWVSLGAAGRYQGVSRKTRRAAAILSTGHSGRNEELGLAIDAVTREGTRPSEGRTVHLSVEPLSVWIPDYLSLAYVFMHECVVHAWCGVEDVESVEAELSKSFHEGWMDCIAVQLLYRSLRETLPKRSFANFAGEIANQTASVQRMRFNADRTSPPPDVSLRIRGERALHTLRRLFAVVLNTHLDDWNQASAAALDPIIKLSLSINASEISHATRGDFVLAIVSRYDRPTGELRATALSKHPQIIDIIGKYIADEDAEDFVVQVTSLGT